MKYSTMTRGLTYVPFLVGVGLPILAGLKAPHIIEGLDCESEKVLYWLSILPGSYLGARLSLWLNDKVDKMQGKTLDDKLK